MKKQIVTIVLGAVVLLGAVTTSFAGGANDLPGSDAFHAVAPDPRRINPGQDNKANEGSFPAHFY